MKLTESCVHLTLDSRMRSRTKIVGDSALLLIGKLPEAIYLTFLTSPSLSLLICKTTSSNKMVSKVSASARWDYRFMWILLYARHPTGYHDGERHAKTQS